MIFTPWNHIFSFETVEKTLKMIHFIELRSFYVCCRLFRLLSCLQCQKNVKKFCWFFSIFIYTIPPGKKFQIFFLENKSFIKVWQVVYITSYFTIAFWSWVVISDSLRNPCNFTISDFRDPTMECSWRPTLRSSAIYPHFPKTSMPKVHSSTNRNFSSSRWHFFLSGPRLIMEFS